MRKHARLLITIAFATAGAWQSAAALADDTRVEQGLEPARLLASSDLLQAPGPGGIPVSAIQVPDPAPALFAGTGAESGSALGATAAPPGTLAELSSTRQPSSHAVRVAAASEAREEARLSTAGPGPANPWAMLCALAVVAYIALKKLRVGTGAGWSERITGRNYL